MALSGRGRLGMQLPHSAARVDSGCVQFGNDWPGVFIRGDDALSYEANIRAILQLDVVKDSKDFYVGLSRLSLERLADLLKSSEVR